MVQIHWCCDVSVPLSSGNQPSGSGLFHSRCRRCSVHLIFKLVLYLCISCIARHIVRPQWEVASSRSRVAAVICCPGHIAAVIEVAGIRMIVVVMGMIVVTEMLTGYQC